MKGSIQIDRERCKGCALCIDSCPEDCISLSDELNLKGYFVAAFDDSKECTACRSCALMCPDVVTIPRRSMCSPSRYRTIQAA